MKKAVLIICALAVIAMVSVILFRPHPTKLQRLTKELSLTPQQVEKVSAILEEKNEKFLGIATSSFAERKIVIKDIEKLLTPEQAIKYKAGDKESIYNWIGKSRKPYKIKLLRLTRQLNLTPQQNKKIGELLKKDSALREASSKIFTKAFAENTKDERKKIKEILTPEQLPGYLTWSEKELEKLAVDLKLTPKQKAKAAAVTEEYAGKSSELSRKSFDDRKAIIEDENLKIEELLTPEQTKEYDKYQEKSINIWFKETRKSKEKRLKGLSRALKLTRQQKEKVIVILDETDEAIRTEKQIHDAARRQIYAEKTKQIEKLLTPEQKKIY